MKNSDCPVCGFELWFEPWINGKPSDGMCPSCGTQFGFDDVLDTEDSSEQSRQEFYILQRKRWIGDGMPWRGSKANRPLNWDAIKQLSKFDSNLNSIDIHIKN